MPKVSVIIPTFNRARKVIRAVDSVFSQNWKDFEIIVVDDGSTDDTDKALSRYSNSIKYIRQPVNRGVSSARNIGIKNSMASWVAFLDSDDYWLPEKLHAQMEFIELNPVVVACQTQEIWMKNGMQVNPKRKHKKPSGNIFKQSLKLCLVSPSCVMLKKSLTEEVGFFDESFLAGEDFDLWLRISCRYPIFLINKWLVVREGGHEDQLSRKITGIDQYRVWAIVKAIKSGMLSSDQTRQAMEELSIKCEIYGKGCIKRGRMEEGYFYLSLPEKLVSNDEKALSAFPGLT